MTTSTAPADDLPGAPEPERLLVPGPHGEVPLRVHRGPGDGALLWCHGGGFVHGDLDMPEADWVARRLVERTGSTVVTVDYRLATEGTAARWPVRWPVPSDDVLAAWAWTTGAERPWAGGSTVLGGASAGANLAAGAVLRVLAGDRPLPVPAGLLLVYPTLHLDGPAPSPELAHALDRLPPEQRFGPDVVRSIYGHLLGTGHLQEPPVAAVPGLAGPDDLRELPPTLVLLSEVDGLRPSGEAFAGSLRAAGVPVRVHTEPGTRHGHLNEPEHPGAGRSTEVIAAWLSERGLRRSS